MILQDKVAIITGSSLRLGRAIALGFAKEGAHIVVNYDIKHDKNDASAMDVCSEIKKMGREVLLIQADVAIENDVKKMIESTIGSFGKIDILVNNAALHQSIVFGVKDCPILEMDAEGWDRVMAVNLRGPFLMSKAVLPQMINKKQGSIINISSTSGRIGKYGHGAYSASKHGLEGLTKVLAEEAKNFNIRVNALEPGGRVDFGKGGVPVHLTVQACVFLASEGSRDISGRHIIATDWKM